MPKRTFKILSIDGGGILGLYSVDILKSIQKEYLSGKRFCDEFQLITGTSTGGIIALGLAVGRTAEEILTFYQKHGKKIFPRWRSFIFPFGFIHNKYSNNNLKIALNNFFRDATITDCKTAICVPAIDITNCQPVIFKTNNNGKLTRDMNTKLKDIAAATSAAPTFFPIYAFDKYSGLVDGGLWQNNPALCGVIEACNCFVGPDKDYDSIRVLSIGNPLSGMRNSMSGITRSSGVIKWRDKLVQLPMKVSSIGTHQILNFLARSKSLFLDAYIRIESENLPSNYHHLKMDAANDHAFSALLERSFFDYNNNKHNLDLFFKEEERNGQYEQSFS
jgi:patatin-like phospholipase/acyl hydrolase